MTSMRADARRALGVRRERASVTPAPVAAPILTTLAVLAAGVLVLLLLGFGLPTVLGAVVAIALIGAIAAYRTTLSLVAGLTLYLVRPYLPGERIRLHAPEHGGTIDAEIVRIGLWNTTLCTTDGLLVVANARMLQR